MKLADLLAYVDGKKTYIVAALTFLVAGLDALGYQAGSSLLIALAAAYGVTIRHAIAKAAA